MKTIALLLTMLVPAEIEEREGTLALYLRALLTGVALLILLASARAQDLRSRERNMTI